MKSYFFVLIAVALLIVGVAPAAAQADDLPGNSTTTAEPDDDAPERIDNNTLLVDSRLEDGEAVLVLESEKTQRITVTDWGQFIRGGPIESSQYILKGGETVTVRHPVELVDGVGGVTISTDLITWSVPLENRYEFLPGSVVVEDVQLAAITGISLTGAIGLVMAWRTKRGAGDEMEQIA